MSLDPSLAPLLAALARQLGAETHVPTHLPDAVFTGPLAPALPAPEVTALPLLREQRAVVTGSVLDHLFLRADGTSIGGIPESCTTIIAGPPGSGKTRTALHALARVALQDARCGLVLAEEAWRDPPRSGREDLCSRFTRSAMAELGMTEQGVREDILPNIRIVESLRHDEKDWPRFIAAYRHLVERDGALFVVVDSLSAIDASRGAPARHLSALRTYNQQNGVTCLVVSQIRDSGAPTGGEPLVHASDAAVLVENRTMQSKEEAARWGANYRDTIPLVSALKSVTTRTLGQPLRVGRTATGVLVRA